MKVLLDSCVAPALRKELSAKGHDVEWVGDWGGDPGDREVLRAAVQAGRTLVTLDRDFGELAILRGDPHCGIVRIVDVRIRDQARRCAEIFARFGGELSDGAIVTVEAMRVRIRHGPGKTEE